MRVARALVQGVDVWLNNPRRPMEASGTSGMKVLANGGLNCSVLDGWWDEGYKPGVGWAIGDRTDAPDTGQQDWLDSRSLYYLIEQEIAPKFYHRAEAGVPTLWIEMMKRSISELTPLFSTNRMVAEYTEKFYVPASQAFLDLGANAMARAKAALVWRDKLRAAWPQVKIVKVTDDAKTKNNLGFTFTVRALVDLGKLSPDEARVQVLAGQVSGSRDLTQVSVSNLELVGQEDSLSVFEGQVTNDIPGHRGYTVRIVPYNPDVAVPSEINLVSWETR
jgi:glycogen phosphorylase